MPGTPASLPTAEYFCQLDGLSFTVQVYQLPDGSFEGKITVDEGSADFNAIYFGDGIDDGSSAGRASARDSVPRLFNAQFLHPISLFASYFSPVEFSCVPCLL